LKINPDAPTALKNYSYCLAARGEQLEKAKQLATHLLETAPGVPAHEGTVAFVLYKLKDFKNAGDLLEKALKNGGDKDASILECYGDVKFQLGDASEAVQYWQKAIEMGGNSATLKKKAIEGKLFE
jgi:tetratricopeptide (TPR) repeat protein